VPAQALRVSTDRCRYVVQATDTPRQEDALINGRNDALATAGLLSYMVRATRLFSTVSTAAMVGSGILAATVTAILAAGSSE
jgi:hypothetical protein